MTMRHLPDRDVAAEANIFGFSLTWLTKDEENMLVRIHWSKTI
jgi:hypothetical protein